MMSDRNSKREQTEGLNFAINEIWQSLQQTVEHYKKSDSSLVFHEGKKQQFHDAFVETYMSIMNAHMDSTVHELDRHKVAAVIIVTALKLDVISRKGPNYGRIFLGKEMIAAEVAFEWMMLRFMRKLKELEYDIAGEFYHMPVAFACDTPYFDIFCRNLYYSQKNETLSPLDIADKLFLIEYITLLKSDIDPEVLHGR